MTEKTKHSDNWIADVRTFNQDLYSAVCRLPAEAGEQTDLFGERICTCVKRE